MYVCMYVGMLSEWLFWFANFSLLPVVLLRQRDGTSGTVLMRSLYFKNRNPRFQKEIVKTAINKERVESKFELCRMEVRDWSSGLLKYV